MQMQQMKGPRHRVVRLPVLRESERGGGERAIENEREEEREGERERARARERERERERETARERERERDAADEGAPQGPQHRVVWLQV